MSGAAPDKAGDGGGEAEGDAWASAWTLRIAIAWGDCDHAGIVFYPQFFRWMDTAFHALLGARGLSHRDICTRFDVIGTPIVEAHAEFRTAVSYDDTLTIAVRVVEWRPRRFRIVYRGTNAAGGIVFEGHEVRALAARDPATGKLRGADVPAELRAVLARDG